MNLKKMAIIALGIFAMSEIALSLFISEAEAGTYHRQRKKKRKSSGYYADTQSQTQSHFNGF